MDKKSTQNLVIANLNTRVPEYLQITDATGRQVKPATAQELPPAGFQPPYNVSLWNVEKQDWHHYTTPDLEAVFTPEVINILGRNTAFAK